MSSVAPPSSPILHGSFASGSAGRRTVRLAVTGANSTGKSTLVRATVDAENAEGAEIMSNLSSARSIADMLGLKSFSTSSDLSRLFQVLCLVDKLKAEAVPSDLLADRSFIDVAAHWVERDAKEFPAALQNVVLDACRLFAESYDLHIYLPLNVIPFVNDGERLRDPELIERVDFRIRSLLVDWDINFIEFQQPDLDERVRHLRRQIRRLRSDLE